MKCFTCLQMRDKKTEYVTGIIWNEQSNIIQAIKPIDKTLKILG